MNFYYLLTILFIISNFSFSQNREVFKDYSKHFAIKRRSVTTQKHADSINQVESKLERRWEGDDVDLFPPPPKPPPTAFYDRKSSIHFIIMPEWYIQYQIQNEFEYDSIYSTGIINITKINRIDLKVSKFSPMWFKISEEDQSSHFIDENRYRIKEINKNVKRMLSGYECYQIKLKNLTMPYRDVELFVTDEIDLNYHPVFNHKSLLTRCFPLYVKFYRPRFVDDVFDEYTFYSN